MTVTDLFEMTPVQAGMLTASLGDPETGRYVQQYWGRIDGALDIGAFRAAWEAVVSRHDILRARCHWEGLDRPALAILAEAAPAWRIEDWSDFDANAAASELARWRENDRARGFDMAAAPLLRFALIRLAPERHVFVWTFHHLLLDGWCGALLVREAMAFYAGDAPPDPPPPFRAYAAWRAAQDMTPTLAYWRDALAGLEGPTPLGLDRPGAPGLTERRIWLGRDLSQAARDFAAREGLTLATLFEGAWALTLARHAGRDDVVFGTVHAGRPAELPGAERMIGLFLNTAPARVAVDAASAPADWLRALQAEGRRREAHALAPLLEIHACSGLPPDTPLFDTLLIVETYPESIQLAAARSGAEIALSETGVHERTEFALAVKALPADDIGIVLAADAARIPEEIVAPLGERLVTALRGLIGAAATLGDIDVLTEAERVSLRAQGQGPTPPAPPLTPERLMTVAARRAGHVAVEGPDGAALSYAQLMARADAIAATLRAAGVGHGGLVAVCQDRTPDLLASLIAAWRCGAAYLPLDPAYPAARIAHILDDSGAAVVLADAPGRAALAPMAARVIDVADCAGADPAPDPNPAPAPVGPDDLAYILYTSGSTGKPKGVPIPHGALANFLASMRRAPGLGPDDRMLALTTIAFDIAALELFGPLWVGGTAALAGTGAAMDGGALARMIAARAITVMQATPAGWRVLCESGWTGAPGLRMFCGGEALDSALARRLLGLGAELWNLYGPTETTIWSGALRLRTAHLDGPKAPIGGPLDHTTLALRDAAGRLTPPGATGELWIGGAGLSPGYLGRPELTADRFVTRGGARFYRSGDRMRLRPDGAFDALGRLDDQIKLRGHRIELGEIEARLEAHPAVAQAAAAVRGEGGAAKLLCWLRAEGQPPPPAVLRAHLAQSLPGYMIPSVFTPIDAFALTPNGKVDRKALTAPQARPRAATAPGQRAELVAGVWAEALGVEAVGPDDDFIALGGHSLSALRVIGELRRHLGADLALRDLFGAPTLAAFCARLDGAAETPPIPRATGAPMLSPAQRRQWMLWRLDPARCDYHLSLAARLDGPLDPAALQAALGALAARHEPLRARFPDTLGAPRPEIAAPGPVSLPVEDVSALAPEAREQAVARRRDAEARAPFALDAAAPWRARLLRLGPEAHVLLLTLHHIIADEWSFAVILRELSAHYRGEAGAGPAAIGYSDVAAWRATRDLAEQRAWWRARLSGAPAAIALPADRPRPTRRDGRGGRAEIRLDAETTQRLERLGRAQGCTIFMTLLAAYALFLHRHGGGRDLVIGTPVSNRRQPETQDLVGLFVNTLALRIDLNGVGDIAGMLTRARDCVLAAEARQDVPFEQVLELVAAPRSESRAPLVQTMFSMPQLPEEGEIAPGLSWRRLTPQARPIRFDLALDLERTPEGLTGGFDYACDLFDPLTAQRLARRFELLLARLDEAACMEDAALLSAEDRARASPALAPAPEGGPADWLAAQAAARPDAPAAPGLDYAGLREAVATEAARLRDAGAAPGTRIAIAGAAPQAAATLLAALSLGGCAVIGADARGGGPEGGLIMRAAGRETVWRAGIFGHLSALAGTPPPGATLRTGPVLDDWAALAGLCAALRHGGALADNGRTGVLETQEGRLRFGADGDVAGPPELPGALLRAGAGWRPAPGVRAVVLDAAGQATPPGVVGALWLGGAGLALGYPGAPGESALRLRPNPQMGPRADAAAEGCLLDAHMTARLADDGLLHQVAPPEAEPPLGTGPAPTQTAAQGGPPRGEAEIALAAIWRALLDAPVIDRDDDFFALGGDSVIAMQVAARAAQAGFAVEPIDLFRTPTLAALAARARPPAPAPAQIAAGDEALDLDALGELVSFGED